MVNSVQLLGRIGKDAVGKTVGDKLVTEFQLATDESWKDDKGVKQTATEWHTCVLWEHKNLIPYLTKGSLIFVTGKLKHDSYDKKVGTETVKMYSTKVVVDEVKLVDTKSAPEA